MASRKRSPRCIIIAGPNGAGKTTFAQEFLPNYAKVAHFVNADLIAAGLSPLKPSGAAIAAGRLFLKEIDRLADRRADFAFESTLSGVSYLKRLERWKASGYRIEIVYLTVGRPELALRRIALRVRQGGHAVPRADVLRRFPRSKANFWVLYRPLADAWTSYENSGNKARLIALTPASTTGVLPKNKLFFDSVSRAMLAAARRARRIAKMYGTPILVLESGRVVAKMAARITI